MWIIEVIFYTIHEEQQGQDLLFLIGRLRMVKNNLPFVKDINTNFDIDSYVILTFEKIQNRAPLLLTVENEELV